MINPDGVVNQISIFPSISWTLYPLEPDSWEYFSVRDSLLYLSTSLQFQSLSLKTLVVYCELFLSLSNGILFKSFSFVSNKVFVTTHFGAQNLAVPLKFLFLNMLWLHSSDDGSTTNDSIILENSASSPALENIPEKKLKLSSLSSLHFSSSSLTF